ncbi:MAG: DNA-processing protein DprA [Chloroflexi bacterium]|nr:DNA-processing protein DprA [Chloroflexota bacterium]
MSRVTDDLQYWVAFHRAPGMGRVRFAALEAHFGSLRDAWDAEAGDFHAAGLDDKTVSGILANRQMTTPAGEMERLERHKVQAFNWHDQMFPSLLKQIYDVPPVLYVRGTYLPQDDLALAVVGTRRATAYGREVAQDLTWELAKAGLTVVSGLAKGIDAVAHHTAIRAGGRTIAVLACGLDMVYPSEHVPLARDVAEGGALISDYPIGTRPRAEYFPRRNRIMSGVSLGTLVIEGDIRSGALITARLALDHNREVFAVPGSILARSSYGPNLLIQRGEAKPVLEAEDILEEFNLSRAAAQLAFPELPTWVGAEQTTLLRLLGRIPLHIDEIYRQSGMSMPDVSSALSLLELSDLVRQVGGMHYVLTREAQSTYDTNQREGVHLL